VAVTCERLYSPKPPFGGRKSRTPETSKATPFLERCSGNFRKRPHLAVGLFLLPCPSHEISPGCSSRNSSGNAPFPLKPGGTGGSACSGEFEDPLRSTVSNSSFFLQGLPYPRNGGTAQPNLPGGFSPHYEDEVDLDTMRFHRKKWTEEVENRKRRDSSLGREALGGAEGHRTFRVSHIMWTYTPGCFRGFGGIIPFSARFPGPVALPVVSPFWNSRWIWFLTVFITWGRLPSFWEMRMRESTVQRGGDGPLSGYRRWRGSAKLLPGNGPVRLVKKSSTRILEVRVAEEIQTTPYERTEGNYSEGWPEGASWRCGTSEPGIQWWSTLSTQTRWGTGCKK